MPSTDAVKIMLKLHSLKLSRDLMEEIYSGKKLALYQAKHKTLISNDFKLDIDETLPPRTVQAILSEDRPVKVMVTYKIGLKKAKRILEYPKGKNA